MEQDLVSLQSMYREVKRYYVIAQRNYEASQDKIKELTERVIELETELGAIRGA